jgi:two-component system OmpR family sensor kinase
MLGGSRAVPPLRAVAAACAASMACALTVVALTALGIRAHPGLVDGSAVTLVSTVARVAACALFLTAGGLRLSRWWMTSEARSAYMGAALVVLGGVVLPLWYLTRLLADGSHDTMLTSGTRAVGTAACVVLVHRALRRGDEDSLALRPHGLVSSAAVVVGGTTVLLLVVWALLPDLLRAGPLLHGGLGLAMVAAWGWLAAVALRCDASRRWAGRAAPLLAGMAVVELMRLLDQVWPGRWLLGAALLNALLAAVTAWCGLADLIEAAASEHERVDALSSALAVANRSATERDAWREEVRHDLRNTLAGLRAALHTLETYDGELDPATAASLRRAALEEVGHVEHLVSDDRLNDSPMVFELSEVLRTAVATRRATGQDVRLHGSAGLVHGRPGDVATVVQNLLVNAATHAPGSPVTVTVVPAGSHVEISVSDRGPGLTEAEAEAAFARGARGASSTGSGLGLYVARSLMQKVGGDVELRNRVDGATFVVVVKAVERRHLEHGVPAPPVDDVLRAHATSRAEARS